MWNKRHHRLKRAIAQALMLRDRRDCASVADYKQFLRLLLAQLNAGRRNRLKVEMPYLRALPERRLESTRRVSVKVDSGSILAPAAQLRQQFDLLPGVPNLNDFGAQARLHLFADQPAVDREYTFRST